LEESGRLQRRLDSFNQSDAGKKWAQHRQNLPVWGIRQGILDSLAEQDVLVVGGDTGCGKTTQVINIMHLINAILLDFGDRLQGNHVAISSMWFLECRRGQTSAWQSSPLGKTSLSTLQKIVGDVGGEHESQHFMRVWGVMEAGPDSI